jgi:hypothetical protein
MGIFSAIGNWFMGIIDKVKALISKLWGLAKPFLREVLSRAAQMAWETLKDLLIEAAQYVATQGLPTDEAKQKAFKDYMILKAKDEVEQLKDSEFNMLREMAVAIVKKANEPA